MRLIRSVTILIIFILLFTIQANAGQTSAPNLVETITPTAIPTQWVEQSRKVVQKLESDITENLHKRFNQKIYFFDVYPEPDVRIIPLGRHNEQLLFITLCGFKGQSSDDIYVYRLNGNESSLVKEFNTESKTGYESVKFKGENLLLVHDAVGTLYVLRDHEFKKVFEFDDTDKLYQRGFTFQTKLTAENNKLYLYRWNSPNEEPTSEDMKGNPPNQKAEVIWSEKENLYHQGSYMDLKK